MRYKTTWDSYQTVIVIWYALFILTKLTTNLLTIKIEIIQNIIQIDTILSILLTWKNILNNSHKISPFYFSIKFPKLLMYFCDHPHATKNISSRAYRLKCCFKVFTLPSHTNGSPRKSQAGVKSTWHRYRQTSWASTWSVCSWKLRSKTAIALTPVRRTTKKKQQQQQQSQRNGYTPGRECNTTEPQFCLFFFIIIFVVYFFFLNIVRLFVRRVSFSVLLWNVTE